LTTYDSTVVPSDDFTGFQIAMLGLHASAKARSKKPRPMPGL
jgi:hypothetical protein